MFTRTTTNSTIDWLAGCTVTLAQLLRACRGRSQCRQLVGKIFFFFLLFLAPLLSVLTNTRGIKVTLFLGYMTFHLLDSGATVPSWAAAHKQTALCDMSTFEVPHQTAVLLKQPTQKKKRPLKKTKNNTWRGAVYSLGVVTPGVKTRVSTHRVCWQMDG